MIAARTHRGLAAAFIAAALAFVGAGCASDPTAGYAAVSTFSEDIRTIAIPIATNETFVRDVEFDLTDALIKEIEARTSWKVVGMARADTVLSAQIRRVDLDQVSKSPVTGLGQEVLVRVTIDFQWKDFRNDATLAERRDFAGQRMFDPSRPTGERVELGRMAVVQLLARDIVDVMRTAW
ncbi:MAG: hypothetical protein GY715_17710 [Planctomycetes bacterium]|nr:hypothetical protein [Planctomycetota bacterium]